MPLHSMKQTRKIFIHNLSLSTFQFQIFVSNPQDVNEVVYQTFAYEMNCKLKGSKVKTYQTSEESVKIIFQSLKTFKQHSQNTSNR